MPYSPPKYPAAIPDTNDLPDYTDDIDYYEAHHINDIKKELRAALIELGVLPKGSYADVAARLTALAQAAIPAGLIAIWHGLIASIPAGWVICDGNNGTPNLLDKFVKGVPTAGTNPGTTGGEANVTLDATMIPAHQHTISEQANHQHVIPNQANHQHTISASGTHTHPITKGADAESGPNTYGVNDGGAAATGAGGDHDHGGNAGAAGSHDHGGNVDAANAHSHGGNTGSSGGGLSHENRPPYYEVAFIMKT